MLDFGIVYRLQYYTWKYELSQSKLFSSARLVRFDPLGHFVLTGITNVNDDDAEVDVDISTPR